MKSSAKKALLAGLALLTLSTSLSAKIINRVIAVVNDEPITSYDFTRKKSLARRQASRTGEDVSDEKILESMYKEIVLKQEARKLGVTISESQIDLALKERMKSFGISSESEFAQALKSSGISLEFFTQQLKKQLLTQAVMQRVASADEVSYQQAKEFYESNKESQMFSGMNERITISWIFVEFPENASFYEQAQKLDKIQNAYKLASAGTKPFAEIATEYSEDEATSTKGGRLGTFKQTDENLSDVAQYAFMMRQAGQETGAVSEVQTSDNGMWIVKIDSISEGEPASFEQVRNRVKNYLYMKNMDEQFQKWLYKKLKRAVIKKLN